MKKALIATLGAGLVLAACDSTEPRVPTTLELSETSLALEYGQTATVTPGILDQRGTAFTEIPEGYAVSWQSAHPNVATVSGGVISAVGAGSTTISATAGQLPVATVSVSVANVPASVSVDPQLLDLDWGTEGTVTARVLNEAGEPFPTPPAGYEITWSTSNEDVATVEDGVVSAVGAGTVTIHAHAGNLTAADVQVTVRNQPTSVAANPTSLSLTPGDEAPVSAAVLNEAGAPIETPPAGYEISWSSSDTEVATVESTGAVTALTEGTATIRAMAGGLAPAEVSVTVEPSRFQLHFEFSGDRAGTVSMEGEYSGPPYFGEGSWAVNYFDFAYTSWHDFYAQRDRGDGTFDILWFYTFGEVTEPGTRDDIRVWFQKGWDPETGTEIALYTTSGVQQSITFDSVSPGVLEGRFEFTIYDYYSGAELDVATGSFLMPRIEYPTHWWSFGAAQIWNGERDDNRSRPLIERN